jgi:hypothetical protein
VLGCQAALLVMLPIMLMLRPVVSLMRSMEHSWWLTGGCLLVLALGAAGGPLVGTRAGLVLVPMYVIGWACALGNLSSAESADLTRARLARAGRRLRDRFMPLRPHLTPDQRN